MPESRICFVVTELLGLVRNGGIATATTHAALVLAAHDYRVELLYCGHEAEMEPEWRSRYAAAGVDVRWLDRSQSAHPPSLADSYRTYQDLKRRDHDVVVFQDWQGLGYCSMLAKRAGLAFDATRLVHICHGPDAWLREANRRLAVDGHQLRSAHLEQRSAELADCIVGPSQHLIDWMAEHGWGLPPHQVVIPYFTEGHTVDIAATPAGGADEGGPLTELVFFGRLEERKGVRILAEALNLLGPRLVAGLGVSFVGRAATVTPDDATAMIDREVRAALAFLRFHGSFDQAQARSYVRQPGRLALIPSLLDNSPNVVYECIEDRVSFLASAAGGTGELVAEADRPTTLFAPDPRSLAEALRPLVESRRKPPAPHPSFDGVSSLAAWRPILAPPAPAPPADAPVDQPLVSVVIPHHDQPVFIWDALRSIAAQDHANLEIVVVDDGSTTAAAIENLERIEAHDFGRPLKVVRQANQYLGAARNTGVRHSAGELIAFLDDDDVAEPTYVSTMVRTMAALDADVVTMAIHGIEADDDGVMHDDAPNAVWVFAGDAPHLDTMVNTVGGAAALYRRSVLDDLGGFFTLRDVGHEDWDLLIRCSLAGKRVVSVPEPLYKYRVRARSMLRTTTTWANMQPVFESYRAVLPPALRPWAELTRGQQDMIDELQSTVGSLMAEREQLLTTLAFRDRYFAIARRVVPLRARTGLRSLINRGATKQPPAADPAGTSPGDEPGRPGRAAEGPPPVPAIDAADDDVDEPRPDRGGVDI